MPKFRVWKMEHYAENVVVDAPDLDTALNQAAADLGYRDFTDMAIANGWDEYNLQTNEDLRVVQPTDK